MERFLKKVESSFEVRLIIIFVIKGADEGVLEVVLYGLVTMFYMPLKIVMENCN